MHLSLKAAPGVHLQVDSRLLEMAGNRLFPANFVAAEDRRPAYEIRLVSSLGAGASRMRHQLFEGGYWERRASTLLVALPDSSYAAEAAIRLGWGIATVEAGGLLIHSSACSFDGVAVVAAGQSGDGKSTLAKLCVEASGARLLSDEMVQVFPDGTCSGTPFRSDCPIPGAPSPSRVGLLVKLAKGADESLQFLSPRLAFGWLRAATYVGGVEPISRHETARRILQLLARVPPRILMFRKSAEAGHFVRRVLSEAILGQ